MTTNNQTRVEELRQQALLNVRHGLIREALPLYDEALALATDADVRELLTINKADALITLDISGPEVNALPAILMRRRNLHHTFLAAYALMFKHRLQNDLKRGIFYGEIALRAAEEAEQTLWKIGALNDLGIIYEVDSQFARAIDCFENAIALIERLHDRDEHRLAYGIALQNLGASNLLADNIEEGIRLIHEAIPSIVSQQSLAEAHIDLCYGYLAMGDLEQARHYGDSGLALAEEPRQVRNAHYLLGDVALKAGDVEAAHEHFDELAKHYPQFRNLKKVLFAFDLRGIINLKL